MIDMDLFNGVLVVTGGRDYDDSAMVRKQLQPFAQQGNVLIVGGARGLDDLARSIWHYEFELPYVAVPARWQRRGNYYDRTAGLARNIIMANGNAIAPHAALYPGYGIVFPGGRGTAHMQQQMFDHGIPFHVV